MTTVFGVDDYRKVTINGGTATEDSRTISVNRVTSKPTDGQVVNIWWVPTHVGDNTQVQSALSVTTSIAAGARPGETWSFKAGIIAEASDETGKPYVGAYSQAVRTRVPGGKTGAIMMGHVVEYRDQSGLPSSQSGVGRGLEVGFFANGADDFADGVGREVIDIVLAKGVSTGPQAVISSLMGVYTNPGDVVLGRGFHFANQIPFTHSLFSSEHAVEMPGASAFLMREGHHLSFGGGRKMHYDAASGKIFLSVNGVNKLSIDAAGNVRAAGTVTAGVTP